MSTDWIFEVKEVQKQEQCSYGEAMRIASIRRRMGPKYISERANLSPVTQEYEDDTTGEGLVTEIGRYARGVWMALKGNRTNFNPKARMVLNRYGTASIVKLEVCRRPLRDAFTNILRIVQNKEQQKMHDQLFHLLIVAHIVTGHVPHIEKIKIEKNENINITAFNPTQSDDMHEVKGFVSGFCINEMLNNALSRTPSSRIFDYDATSTNCQLFVHDVLKANNLLTPSLDTFVMQDVSKILPTWSKKLARVFTDIANRGKTIVEGEGIDSDDGSESNSYEPRSLGYRADR